MGSSSNRLFKLAQIKFLDVSPNHPDRMIGRHQRLQIDCPKLDLIAYRFPHPWLSRIGHPLVFLYRKIGKKFVARHRCTSRTVQQQESLPACKLNPNRAQRFTASTDEGSGGSRYSINTPLHGAQAKLVARSTGPDL